VEGGLRGFWGRVRRDVEPNYETIFPRTVQPRTVQPWVAPIGLKLIPYTRPSGSGRGPGSGRGRPLCGRPKRERKPPYPPALVPVRSAPVRSAPVRSAPVRSAPVRSAPVRSPAMSASLRPQLRPPGPGFAPRLLLFSCVLACLKDCGRDQGWWGANGRSTMFGRKPRIGQPVGHSQNPGVARPLLFFPESFRGRDSRAEGSPNLRNQVLSLKGRDREGLAYRGP